MPTWIRGCDGTRVCDIHVHVLKPEIRVIGNVEGFPTELRIAALGDSKPLDRGKIDRHITRPIQNVRPELPKRKVVRGTIGNALMSNQRSGDGCHRARRDSVRPGSVHRGPCCRTMFAA